MSFPENPDDELLDVLNHKCDGCQIPLPFESAFCGACGKRNPDFDDEIFEKAWRISVYRKREMDCNEAGHRKAVATSDSDILNEFPYCQECGERLIP